ncbi:General stress protein 69 [Oceanobacillus oncorhynchi]|uniref:General stress protein 69 n=1 Tax=Oceanobacillus oncorhynchi TaxID=545501 RepID=A0A0A1MMU4_9BACI|nr:aldo/keto reductase [Oceanobacillus oncorhynchi]CEI80411.1 General stress protein 69 [Oceanobacillus oncorhynchi]
MKYITLKGIKDNKYIEKKCSRLIMGSGQFYQYESEEDNFKILDNFIEMGGNMFDTGHQYFNSEVTLGKWIKERGNREKIYILTKGAHPDDGEPGKRVNPASITKDVLESLERLNIGYIDFYALHRDDPSKEVGPIIEVLNEHLAAGRIHAIGASNWTYERIQEANEYASKHGLIGFTFNSPSLSLAKCNEVPWPDSIVADQEMIDWHKGNQLPLLSWSSQAMGFFSGKFSPEDRSNEELVRVYYNDENWKKYEIAKEIGSQKNMSAIQISLAYVLNQSFPTAAIIGPMEVSELASSLEGSKIRLTADEIKWLDLTEIE